MKNIINKGTPEPGKIYALTGKLGDKCISNGNTWKESEVKESNICRGCGADRNLYNGFCNCNDD